MITDKICFIHLRECDETGQPYHKGGATIAWYVDGDTGDILIGRPAICNSKEDEFVRKTGRDVALEKLNTEDPLAIVNSDFYAELAIQNFKNILHYYWLSPNGNADLIDGLADQIRRNPTHMLSSAWFEARVRDIVSIKHNKVFLKGYNKPYQKGDRDPVTIYANTSK